MQCSRAPDYVTGPPYYTTASKLLAGRPADHAGAPRRLVAGVRQEANQVVTAMPSALQGTAGLQPGPSGPLRMLLLLRGPSKHRLPGNRGQSCRRRWFVPRDLYTAYLPWGGGH